jgi:hypothetical protein
MKYEEYFIYVGVSVFIFVGLNLFDLYIRRRQLCRANRIVHPIRIDYTHNLPNSNHIQPAIHAQDV